MVKGLQCKVRQPFSHFKIAEHHLLPDTAEFEEVCKVESKKTDRRIVITKNIVKDALQLSEADETGPDMLNTVCQWTRVFDTSFKYSIAKILHPSHLWLIFLSNF